MQFDVITIFPNYFTEFLSTSVIKNAISKNIISVNIHDLRDYTNLKHKQIDDKPYGGGVGMILMAEPIIKAVKAIKKNNLKSHVILLSPTNNFFTQKKAIEYSTKFEQIILICGRYEGVDERINQTVVDEVISIGEYVLTGGEIPTMVLIDATSRMIKGFFEKDDVLNKESYIDGRNLEYPQYTKPETVEGISVPNTLISGNHQNIVKWKEENTKKY